MSNSSESIRRRSQGGGSGRFWATGSLALRAPSCVVEVDQEDWVQMKMERNELKEDEQRGSDSIRTGGHVINIRALNGTSRWRNLADVIFSYFQLNWIDPNRDLSSPLQPADHLRFSLRHLRKILSSSSRRQKKLPSSSPPPSSPYIVFLSKRFTRISC